MTEPRSVIIVDGEVVLANSLADFLAERGYRVACHTDSVQAVAALIAAGFDAAILDLNMPRVSGAEVAAMALRANPGTALIFMTGLTNQDEVRALTSPFAGATVLKKPFDLADLTRLLEEKLG